MWRLKFAEGNDDPYLYSTNNFIGRQIWEYDPNGGTIEELARQQFHEDMRKGYHACSDLFARIQQAERDVTPLHRGAKVLINAQMDDGDHGSVPKDLRCVLHYPHYRNVFCLWALAEYRKRVWQKRS